MIDATIAQYIGSQVAALTYGTNLFYGPIRAVSDYIPAQCVFVHVATGGAAPVVYADGGGGQNVSRPSVQIFVRSEASDFSVGQTIANDTYLAVRKAAPGGTLGTLALESAPLYVGRDETDRHIWSINITTYYKD